MLMERTAGIASVAIALIDGPVALGHPDLPAENVRMLSGAAACIEPDSTACRHERTRLYRRSIGLPVRPGLPIGRRACPVEPGRAAGILPLPILLANLRARYGLHRLLPMRTPRRVRGALLPLGLG
jgi:hypothetical protein